MQSIQFVSPTLQPIYLILVVRPPPKFCSFLCENLQVHVEASGSIGRNDSAVSTPLSPKPARIDGRRLRSERTKQLIIEAYLALLRENPVVAMPTAAQIADRAGYSVRSIFERFPDLGKLRVRISRDRTIERMEVMYRPEFSTLAEQERKYMLVALEAITDIESWERMREQHGLSFEEACSVWIGAIDRMLPPTPPSA